eukprot:TRINITY_DN73_c0_g2_i1.p1 TRINITY_DN73_c0_g2~~TRINITY_DN73_c0_g2_i1.p1  ORF type:complete len:513 (+),score=45.00 TRINITY_DN73_c0_g2_i1:468-2006(+)
MDLTDNKFLYGPTRSKGSAFVEIPGRGQIEEYKTQEIIIDLSDGQPLHKLKSQGHKFDSREAGNRIISIKGESKEHTGTVGRPGNEDQEMVKLIQVKLKDKVKALCKEIKAAEDSKEKEEQICSLPNTINNEEDLILDIILKWYTAMDEAPAEELQNLLDVNLFIQGAKQTMEQEMAPWSSNVNIRLHLIHYHLIRHIKRHFMRGNRQFPYTEANMRSQTTGLHRAIMWSWMGHMIDTFANIRNAKNARRLSRRTCNKNLQQINLITRTALNNILGEDEMEVRMFYLWTKTRQALGFHIAEFEDENHFNECMEIGKMIQARYHSMEQKIHMKVSRTMKANQNCVPKVLRRRYLVMQRIRNMDFPQEEDLSVEWDEEQYEYFWNNLIDETKSPISLAERRHLFETMIDKSVTSDDNIITFCNEFIGRLNEEQVAEGYQRSAGDYILTVSMSNREWLARANAENSRGSILDPAYRDSGYRQPRTEQVNMIEFADDNRNEHYVKGMNYFPSGKIS